MKNWAFPTRTSPYNTEITRIKKSPKLSHPSSFLKLAENVCTVDPFLSFMAVLIIGFCSPGKCSNIIEQHLPHREYSFIYPVSPINIVLSLELKHSAFSLYLSRKKYYNYQSWVIINNNIEVFWIVNAQHISIIQNYWRWWQ